MPSIPRRGRSVAATFCGTRRSQVRSHPRRHEVPWTETTSHVPRNERKETEVVSDAEQKNEHVRRSSGSREQVRGTMGTYARELGIQVPLDAENHTNSPARRSDLSCASLSHDGEGICTCETRTFRETMGQSSKRSKRLTMPLSLREQEVQDEFNGKPKRKFL